jgi:hypothetical protein
MVMVMTQCNVLSVCSSITTQIGPKCYHTWMDESHQSVVVGQTHTHTHTIIKKLNADTHKQTLTCIILITLVLSCYVGLKYILLKNNSHQ